MGLLPAQGLEGGGGSSDCPDFGHLLFPLTTPVAHQGSTCIIWFSNAVFNLVCYLNANYYE